ncbi:uncharacterized protein LOC109806542 isoform X2 [Cajanus cajan]|nr:uncharacterized protein LOC109806542 isoform X2 [Cajanus cajan]XP_020224570.1 uncharacterized protein LOC109806542 isoform X2 [Cajanus cajan]
MPRKAKRSKKRPSRVISNLMPHASSQGHSTSVEPQLQPSKLAQPSMPHDAKRSNKKVRHGTSNLMSHASSQGHSTPVEPSLQHSKETQPCAPTITIIPPSVPTAQNTVPAFDLPSHTMPRKAKYSNKRACHGISNLVPHASSQGHSTPMKPPLKPSKAVQPRASAITFIPPSIPTAQNLVLPSDAPSLMPRKAKFSRERASLGISNVMPYASSRGHSTYAEPPLQPAQVAQSCSPSITLAPLSVPTTQNLVSPLDPPLHKMPRKGKHSKKRGSHGISSLTPQASSQGNSTYVELPLQPSPALQSSAPAYSTAIPRSIPTAQNLVSASVEPPRSLPRKAKLSRERASLGISNLMPNASSRGHSSYVEPPPQPAKVAQSCAPSITLVPPSIPTTQNLVSPLDPPLPTKHRKAKHSKKRGFHGISNLMSHTSSQGHLTHVEQPLQPRELSYSYAPTMSHISSSIPTAQDPLSPSDPPSFMPPKNVFSGILNLMRHASCQGHSIPTESLQQPSKLAQPCAPTTTDIPPSFPTAQDLVSPSNIPSCSMPRKSKRLRKGVSHSMSNLMPHASYQGYSIPMEPLLQPPELARACASPASSIRVTQDPVSPSDPQSHTDPVSASDPSSNPLTQDPVSPSDPSSHSRSDTFVLPYAPTQQPLAPYYRPFRGRQWNVQAIDEHGNTKEIQVTKPGVFEMPPGQRIVVPFDGQLRAYGEAATLLSGACGRIVTDSKNIPINFDSWPKVPKSYKDDCFNILKTKFHFQASESVARRYCLLTMSRKYRNGKLKLWTHAFDPSLSREQLIAKAPYGIPNDQWLSFIDNHLKPEYQELCRKNAVVRQRQTVPHTSGAKLLSRKQHEMELELGRSVSRVELYLATHKKKDGSYVNEEARTIGEKLTEEISKSANSTEIATNDALAKVLGLDHSGRVRCLGLGGLHSVAFQSSVRFSDVAESSRLKEEVISLKTKLAASEENVKTLQTVMLTYIQMKEGHIPAELGALFDTTNQADESSGQDMSTSESGSSLASNHR